MQDTKAKKSYILEKNTDRLHAQSKNTFWKQNEEADNYHHVHHQGKMGSAKEV